MDPQSQVRAVGGRVCAFSSKIELAGNIFLLLDENRTGIALHAGPKHEDVIE